MCHFLPNVVGKMTKDSDYQIIERELSDLTRLYGTDEEGVFVDKDDKPVNVKFLGLAEIVINHPVILQHLNGGRGDYRLIADDKKKSSVNLKGPRPSKATAYFVGDLKFDSGRTYEKNSYGWSITEATITYFSQN